MNYVWQHQWSQHIDQRLYIETRVSFFKVCRGIPSCNWHVTRFSPCTALVFSFSSSFFFLLHFFLLPLPYSFFSSFFLFLIRNKNSILKTISRRIKFSAQFDGLQGRYGQNLNRDNVATRFTCEFYCMKSDSCSTRKWLWLNQQSIIRRWRIAISYSRRTNIYSLCTNSNSMIF